MSHFTHIYLAKCHTLHTSTLQNVTLYIAQQCHSVDNSYNHFQCAQKYPLRTHLSQKSVPKYILPSVYAFCSHFKQQLHG